MNSVQRSVSAVFRAAAVRSHGTWKRTSPPRKLCLGGRGRSHRKSIVVGAPASCLRQYVASASIATSSTLRRCQYAKSAN